MTKPDEEKDLASIVFTLVFMALVAIAAWRLIHHLPKLQPTVAPSISADATPTPQSRVQETPPPKLNIRQNLLTQLLQAQPDQNQASLTQLLASLSDEAVRGMGNYRRVNYESWLLKARQSGVSVRAIEALADAQFVSWFPSQEGKTLNPRILGQVWYAIARNQIAQLNVQTVQLDSKFNGKLNNGQGKIYQLKLQTSQIVSLKLQASEPSVKFFIFSEFGSRVAIAKNQWSGNLKPAKAHEIIVVTTSMNPVNYTLEIARSSKS